MQSEDKGNSQICPKLSEPSANKGRIFKQIELVFTKYVALLNINDK